MCRGRKASARFRSPEPGWRSRATPILARRRSRCAERGLRQAGCVAARPAAGCSRLQSFICCGPTIPQVWQGMSSAGLEARRTGTVGIHGVRLLLCNERSKGKRRDPFHGRGGRPKADHVGFLHFDSDIAFPSPTLTKDDDGAAHGVSTLWLGKHRDRAGRRQRKRSNKQQLEGRGSR